MARKEKAMRLHTFSTMADGGFCHSARWVFLSLPGVVDLLPHGVHTNGHIVSVCFLPCFINVILFL